MKKIGRTKIAGLLFAITVCATTAQSGFAGDTEGYYFTEKGFLVTPNGDWIPPSTYRKFSRRPNVVPDGHQLIDVPPNYWVVIPGVGLSPYSYGHGYKPEWQEPATPWPHRRYGYPYDYRYRY